MNGLTNCLQKLRPTDYVYFNMGNSSQILMNDKVSKIPNLIRNSNIREWQKMEDYFGKAFKKLDKRVSVRLYQDIQNNNVEINDIYRS